MAEQYEVKSFCISSEYSSRMNIKMALQNRFYEFVAIFSIFIFKIWNFVHIKAAMGSYPDSGGYRPYPMKFSLNYVNFLGNFFRPWTITLPYGVMPNDRDRML